MKGKLQTGPWVNLLRREGKEAVTEALTEQDWVRTLIASLQEQVAAIDEALRAGEQGETARARDVEAITEVREGNECIRI